MNEGAENRVSTKLRSKIRYLIWAVVVAIVLTVALPSFTTASFVDPLLRQKNRLHPLSRVLAQYAAANDGKFPAKLELLAEFSAAASSESLKYHDLRTHEPLDWIYFSGHSTAEPRGTILIASPRTVSKADGTRMVGSGNYRLVASADARTAVISEEAYQAYITEQQKPEWAQPSEAKANWSFLDAFRNEPITTAGALNRTKSISTKEISRLLNTLKNGKQNERWDAAEALGETGESSPEVVPALLAALNDNDAAYCAGKSLVRKSLSDPTVLPALLEVIRSKEKKAAYWAVVALEEIAPKDDAAIPLLIDALDGDTSDMRTAAAEALGAIGPGARAAVPSLTRNLGEGTEWTVKCAAIALGRIGPDARDAVPSLLAMFDADSHYAIDAARAIWQIDPALGSGLVPKLIAALESQRNPNGSNEFLEPDFFSAIDLLGEIGPEARAAIPILEANLPGGAASQAAWALWRIDPVLSDKLTPIFTNVLTPKAPDRLDGWVRGKHVAPPRPASIFDAPFPNRILATGALWQMHPGKRQELARLLAEYVREWHPDRILKTFSPESRSAVPALAEIQKSSPDPDLRTLATEALRSIAATNHEP